MSVREFCCHVCRGVYQTSKTRQDLEAQFLREYGQSMTDCTEPLVSLCSGCSAEYRAWKASQG